MTGDDKRKISSLRDLPADIAPPRDLWRGIEARIAAESSRAEEIGVEPDQADVAEDGRVRHVGPDLGGVGDGRARRGVEVGGSRGGARFDGPARRRLWQPDRVRVLAAAAVIAALAVGIWIGRAVLPGPAGAGLPGSAGETGAWRASYLLDSKYTRQRAQLVKGLEARLAALPPESRAKVMKSLQAISDSKRDLEAELGKDPSNALLQELLVNTYQDEMRVLTALQTGGTSEGI